MSQTRPGDPVTEEMINTEAIESALKAIGGVRAARLVTDGQGKPVEVHIVAGNEKSPKQLVRDIQTVSLATFGLDLDHRIVSVVQFPEDMQSEPKPATEGASLRPTIEEVATEVRGSSANVRISLRRGTEVSSGSSSGPNTREGILRASAMATLQAITQLVEEGTWIDLEHIALQRSGTQDVAVATVSFGGSKHPGSLAGSAVVTGLPGEAAVRAILDALNRKLWRQ